MIIKQLLSICTFMTGYRVLDERLTQDYKWKMKPCITDESKSKPLALEELILRFLKKII